MKKEKEQKRLFPTCFPAFRLGGGSQPVSNFPAVVSKFIVKEMFIQWMALYGEFYKDIYVILDGSTGWGGRLVGILGSYTDLRNRYRILTGRELTICYITTDPHKKIHPRFKWIIDDWFKRIEPDVDRQYFNFHKAKLGSQTPKFYNFCRKIMDQYGVTGAHLSLTSPPYFNREKYSNDEGQCWKQFDNYKSWRDGFLKPSIQNIFNLLLPKGRFYFNIADLKEKKLVHSLQKNSTDFSLEIGFQWIQTYKMLLSGSGKNSINKVMINGKPRKYEPIFVLEKQ
jgi:hypothetical protein